AARQDMTEPREVVITLVRTVVGLLPVALAVIAILELELVLDAVIPDRTAVIEAQREALADQDIGERHVVAGGHDLRHRVRTALEERNRAALRGRVHLLVR